MIFNKYSEITKENKEAKLDEEKFRNQIHKDIKETTNVLETFNKNKPVKNTYADMDCKTFIMEVLQIDLSDAQFQMVSMYDEMKDMQAVLRRPTMISNIDCNGKQTICSIDNLPESKSTIFGKRKY